jgi:nucleotide-binding universal stress UspA family protein
VESRPPLLLILSAMRQSGEAVQFALERAREAGVGVVVLYVADEGIAESAARELELSGFVGDEPADLVTRVLLKAYKERGTEDLERIATAASKAGVTCETEMREGDFYEQCRGYMTGQTFSEIVAIRRRRSHLSRYLFGSVINKLRELRPEPFTVFTEEEP